LFSNCFLIFCLSSLHGIPSLFYSGYKNFFDDTIILFNEHDNQVELHILSGESNIIEIYGIGCRGSLKITYVCRKFFYILSVRDDLMLTMVALKRSYTGYLHATVTDKEQSHQHAQSSTCNVVNNDNQ
ncbi:hypothetical protein HN51_022174, partial [Arachis hypogaea]